MLRMRLMLLLEHLRVGVYEHSLVKLVLQSLLEGGLSILSKSGVSSELNVLFFSITHVSWAWNRTSEEHCLSLLLGTMREVAWRAHSFQGSLLTESRLLEFLSILRQNLLVSRLSLVMIAFSEDSSDSTLLISCQIDLPGVLLYCQSCK